MVSNLASSHGILTHQAPVYGPSLNFGASNPDKPRICPSGESADILEVMPELGKYGTADLEASFRAISKRSAKYFDTLLLNFLPPAQRKGIPGRLAMGTRKEAFAECMTLAAQYGELGRRGILEESADMLFEQYSVVALRKGLITRQQIGNWTEMLNTHRTEGAPFFTVLDKIASDLSEDQVKAFADFSGIPEKRARKMMGIIGIKFAQFQARSQDYDPLKDARTRVVSEARELAENLPGSSPSKFKIVARSLLHAHMPGLPPQRLRKAAMDVVQKRLGPSVDYDTLMHYVFIKQLGRQELDYENPDLTYNQRKAILKLLETLLETHLLKEAAIPTMDIAPQQGSRTERKSGLDCSA